MRFTAMCVCACNIHGSGNIRRGGKKEVRLSSGSLFEEENNAALIAFPYGGWGDKNRALSQ